jgi:hypothetical protein
MKKYFSVRDIPFFILSFFIPLILYYITSSSSLMFDDAAEFALVIKLGSIAHPPGTPAYILFGMIWLKITSIFGINTINALTLFSAVCVSLSSLLLYCVFKLISSRLSFKENFITLFLCSCVALAFSTAATTWAWGNTVEVYSFQLLSMAIAMFGLVGYHFERKKILLIIAGIGLACGLGNHHLTMILFLPFTPFFFLDNIFVPQEKPEQKKKIKRSEEPFLKKFLNVFSMRDFWLLTIITTIITIFFYGWMVYRAQSEYPFMFGAPSTFSELIFHMSGGAYTKNITATSEKIISARVPYFLKLTSLQLFVFLPFFIAGILVMVRKKLYPLMWLVIIYFLFLFLYQLNNNQWSSTDAYMLLPFFVLMLPVFYGVIFYADKIKAQFVIPFLLCIQIIYNYPTHDRRTYPVSETLMNLLDKSAPKNSVVIISDWSLIIQYYYYRIVENFRPDLVVLNYDLKFTHYRILPVLYPEYYKKIKPQYDKFIEELGKEHPHQIINTGCDLSTEVIVNSFKALLGKIESNAKTENRYLLTDPRAHYFFSTNNYYDPRRYVSGCFSSSIPGDSSANDNFLKLDLPILKSKLLFEDPAALDKLVDFQAMLDRHIEYYTANNDMIRLRNAQDAHDRVIKFQRDMKKSMSFAYKK